MSKHFALGRFSLGMGDRFGRQAKAQLQACILAAEQGVAITPVWNKSHREHSMIGSEPASVRAAAQQAVRDLGWKKPWHVDADDIRFDSMDGFLDSSDFFTIDVADTIGKRESPEAVERFIRRHPELIGKVVIPNASDAFETTPAEVERAAGQYLSAVEEAGRIYRQIANVKGKGKFITEISMDEVPSPQTPAELLMILAMISEQKIPLQTIAPRFSGRFNKGVDYVGDIKRFEKEFKDDLAVIEFAIREYNLPSGLKLSMHSGSDKFSLYPPIRRALEAFDAGLHVKTAGTTWLEELIGLAECGGEALALAKEIYCEALDHRHELCAPYAMVIDIDEKKLPSKKEARQWTSGEFAAALRHGPRCKEFNPHLRQLLHVAFKIAAQKGDRFLKTLEACETEIARNVTVNLYERHIRPLFIVG